jgi:succinoglycan biosynthesis transport protein ExoP
LGLLQALADPSVLPSAMVKDEGANLHVLPCVRAGGQLARDAELLGAERMTALLKGLRKFYKYIVLDIAPVVPVVDARALAPLADCFILVVKWAETDRRMVGEAVTTEGVQPRLLGAVLNQVDSQTIRELESYRGKEFYRYYLESR